MATAVPRRVRGRPPEAGPAVGPRRGAAGRIVARGRGRAWLRPEGGPATRRAGPVAGRAREPWAGPSGPSPRAVPIRPRSHGGPSRPADRLPSAPSSASATSGHRVPLVKDAFARVKSCAHFVYTHFRHALSVHRVCAHGDVVRAALPPFDPGSASGGCRARPTWRGSGAGLSREGPRLSVALLQVAHRPLSRCSALQTQKGRPPGRPLLELRVRLALAEGPPGEGLPVRRPAHVTGRPRAALIARREELRRGDGVMLSCGDLCHG